MSSRRLILLLVLLVPVVTWGQNIFINEKLIQAEEIKSTKGVCPEYIDVLFEAKDIAERERDKDAIIKICEELLDATLQVYPNEKDLIMSSRLYLALMCSELGEHEKALPYLKDCLQRIKGTDYEAERVLIGDIVTAYFSLGNLNDAISYQKQLNSLTLKNEGKGYKYAGGLYWISTLYLEVPNKKEAIRVLKEALAVLESASLQEDPLYYDVKYRYEVLTNGTSSVTAETDIRRASIKMLRQFDDTNNPDYIFEALKYLEDKDFLHDIDTLRYHAYESLAHYYYQNNDYQNTLEATLQKPYWDASDYFLTANCEEAEGHFELAREGYKQAWAHAFLEKNDVSKRFFTYFDLYARNCIQTGYYQEAFGFLEQFYAGDATIPGFESRAAQYMAMLAQLKYSINDYRGTIDCVNKCAPLFLKVGAIDDYITNMWLVAGCHEQLGDYASCAEVLKNLLMACKSYPEYYDYEASTEVAMAVYLAQCGQKELAEKTVASALSRFSTHDFSNFWMESVYHNALGHYYQLIEDRQQAEKEFLIGAELLKKNAPENDYNYPQQLAALANLYLEWPGNESKALPVYEEAFNLTKKYHDEAYAPYFAYNMGVVASKYYNEIPVSGTELSSFINVERIQAQNLLFQMSETEREAFWKNHSDTKDLVFSFANKGIATSILYDYALLYKGLLLSSTTQIGRIVTAANNEELNSLFGRYSLLSRQNDDANTSKEQIERLEHQVLAKCRELGYSINAAVSVTDVASSLEDNSVAIEFVDYKQLGIVSDTTEVYKYAAFVMKKNWEEPKYIDLGKAEGLTTIIQSKDKAYRNQALYNLIWKPLEQFIPEGYTVYYSPAGLLHQVALEAIPVDEKTILSEHYSLVRLSSTRELCNTDRVKQPYSTSAVYGGLQYSLSEDDMLSNSKLYSYSLTPVSDDYLSRGGNGVSPWRFLPGTRAEAEAVNSLLLSSNISSTLYVGASGNEESFKALSGQSPSIIHIATHGFYLQNQDFTNSVSQNSDMRGQLQIQKSALKRSGLIMSGANPAWTEGKLLPNVEDGILTSEEISYLDLRNTSLAIVSACDSGLGEINNDGVEGLQRAFKSAGVNTLVVTLWKVDDAATELMMTEFYKNLTSGQPRRAAFDSARATIRSRFPEPYYWAPFVMID